MGRKHKIITTLSILAFLMAGCGMGESNQGLETMENTAVGEVAGNTGEQGAAGGGEQKTEEDDSRSRGPVTWQPEYFSLENVYTQILPAGRNLYGLYDREGQTLLDKIGKETFTVEGTVPLPDISLSSGMAADVEGNVYLLEPGETSVSLWKIHMEDSSGENHETEKEKAELEDAADENDLFLKGITRDEKGYCYVWCEIMIPRTEKIEGRESTVWYIADRVYVKDEQLKTVYYEDVADVSGVEVLYFQIGGDGTPVFLLKDQDEIYLQKVDGEKQGEKERIKLGKALDCFGMEDANIPEHLVSTDRGWLYCRNNELLEFDSDTKEKERILGLSAHGILSSDILFLSKSEDRIEIVDSGGDSGALEFIVFTPGRTDKETLTLGVTMASRELEEAVAAFNRFSSEYRVELVDYISQAESYEEASEKFKLDVVTGKAPDIIAVSGIDDYQILCHKGVLADLYDFMEADAACSKDMLMESVVKACEDAGHLYSIAPAFQLHSMWGYGDVTGGQSGVTFRELLQILEKSGKDLNAIGGFSADEPVLTRLCSVSMDEFVNWEEGTCEFDGDYFKKVLSFAGQYHPVNVEGTYLGRIRDREQVLSVGIISSVADYQLQKEFYDGDLAFIGYPVAEGSGTVVDFRGSAVAVNAGKENQAGAWEFVKFYLLQGYDGQGFPVVREQFEKVMEAAMEEDYITSENGGTERLPKEYYNSGTESIFVYAASRTEVAAVRELIERGGGRFEMHPVIQNIINEEAEGYFSGQVDLDRTAEKIQNRVNLYLQESR
ncbi:MAG: extracellular solute-binding protein [Lachnospiraceae bacterium]|nr:extracellular solute-binding protein [Lachnospiraceae bacterium]